MNSINEPAKDWARIQQLLKNLERLLSLQAQEIARKKIESVVQLSDECADICQQLRPMLTTSSQDELQDESRVDDRLQAVETDRLIRSCRALQQSNSHALARLASYCNTFMNLLRGPPLSYDKHSTVVYQPCHHFLCKL